MKQTVIFRLAVLALMLTFFALPVTSQINGFVNYHENPDNPLPDVTIELLNSNGDLVATTITDSVGEFSFYGLAPGDYTIVPSTTLPIGVIDVIDAALILAYLNGTYDFTEYEFVAADVNGSGNVTYGDYVLLTVFYLMQGNPFPTDEWQFDEVEVNVSASRDATEPAMVWATSTGDVEGIWMPGSRDIVLMDMDNQEVTIENDDEVEIVVGTDYTNKIGGFNLNISFPTDIVEITNVTGPDDNFHYEINNQTGELKVIWLDENQEQGNYFASGTLFKLKLRKHFENITDLEGDFVIEEGGMVIDTRLNSIEDITINLPTIKTIHIDNDFQLNAMSYPNPATDNINIDLTSPLEGSAALTIYDITGRIVEELPIEHVKLGTQHISMDISDFKSGQYFYRIVIDKENVQGRFQK